MSKQIRCSGRLGLLSATILALVITLHLSRWTVGQPPPGYHDIKVGDIQDTETWAHVNGTTAFSIGTTSCNIGTLDLNWDSSTKEHPVIAQNMYVIKAGAIRQIGLAWVKHGFAVDPGDLCGTCQQMAEGILAVNCSDPYYAGLNGLQGRLGPRSEVNVFKGDFPIAASSKKLMNPTQLSGRIQVGDTDLDPSTNSDSVYVVEAQYVHPQDALDGRGNNNASYRKVKVTPHSDATKKYQLVFDGLVIQEKPAIFEWQKQYPDAQLTPIDVPDDGRMHLGIRTTPVAAGGFHTEIALHNLTSHRCARALTVATGGGAIRNARFFGVKYDQEDYNGSDWTAQISGSSIAWSTGSDVNKANAVRWATLYGFSFDSDSRPTQATIGFLRNATGQAASSAPIPVQTPPTEANVAQLATTWFDPATTRRTVDLGSLERETDVSVTCREGVKADLRTTVKVDPKFLEVADTKSATDSVGRTIWTIRLRRAPNAPQGYFESIVNVQTNRPGDRPLQIRAHGELK